MTYESASRGRVALPFILDGKLNGDKIVAAVFNRQAFLFYDFDMALGKRRHI
jgi:hypothetical protein